jgi:hypothetical protein
MKVNLDWTSWTLGERVIMGSGAAALFSFFLPWVDIGISRNGFSQGTFLLFGLYIYPLQRVLVSKELSRLVGLMLAIICVISGFWYVSEKVIELFDETISASSTGAHLFIAASFALAVGVWIRTNEQAAEIHAASSVSATVDLVRVKLPNLWFTRAKRVACPDCAEMIMEAARVCRYCGYRTGVSPADRTNTATNTMSGQIDPTMNSSSSNLSAPSDSRGD